MRTDEDAVADRDIMKRALALVVDQCNEAEGHVRTLAQALRDIEDIAQDNLDLGRDDLNNIIHICQTGGVRTAMSVTASQE